MREKLNHPWLLRVNLWALATEIIEKDIEDGYMFSGDLVERMKACVVETRSIMDELERRAPSMEELRRMQQK